MAKRLDYNEIAPNGTKALGGVKQCELPAELVDLTIAISLTNAYNRVATRFRNMPQAAIKN